MKNKLTIKVTKNDIENGQPRNGRACAISKACKRIYPDYAVFSQPGYVLVNGKKFTPNTQRDTAKLRKFINNFDDYGGSRKYCRPTTIHLVEE